MTSLYTYFLAGQQIVSDAPLPLATSPDADAHPSERAISIRFAKIPDSLAPEATKFPDAEYDGRNLLLTVPDDVRFLIRDGREILVEPMQGAAENDVTAYLLGSAFGALFHQRGMLPLHASAVDVAGGCIAFVGTSGAGKSTLIAALASRGYQVISDDVCFIARDSENGILAWPGIGRIRLWEDAVKALNMNQANIQREFRGYNKFLIPVCAPNSPLSPRPLLAIYLLDEVHDGPSASIAPVHGAATIEMLMPNVYRLELAEYMNLKPRIFTTCAEIARNVPTYKFSRKKDFDLLSTVMDHLEKHIAGYVTGTLADQPTDEKP